MRQRRGKRMPYAKRAWKGFYRGFKKGVKGTVGAVNYAIKEVNKLKNLVNVEMKKYDSNATLTVGGTSVLCLNCPAQGDGHSSRDGNKIRCKYIHVRCGYSVDLSETNRTWLRLTLVCNKDVNGTAPVYTDVWQDEANSTRDILAMRNIDNLRDFWVIRDKLITLPAYAANPGDKTHGYIDWYIPVDIKTQFLYGETAAATASLDSNGIFLIINDTSATNHATVETIARVGYIDN